MDEQVFFDNNGVKVTNARFIVDANTYSIRNSTSTAAWTRSQKWMRGAVLILVGLASLFCAPVIGVIFLAVAG